MKITVTIEVPEGELCLGCNLWYRAENGKCHCMLFGMIELDQRKKVPAFMLPVP